MPRTISFLGSVALLVSSITGPSMVVVPLLFQQAGWLTPLLMFAIIGFLSGAASLFLVEAMSSIEGNEEFQASIEYTTIAHLFLGKRWHVVVQILAYLALQILVVSSLLESFQSMDAFILSIAHKTCAVSFTDGWVCVNQVPANGGSAFSGYILGSFGTLITLCLILPLSLVRLVDNIIFQVVSFILLLVITVMWIVIFAVKGLKTNPTPVVGSDQSSVVGFIISNFSFVITIPAWVNNTHPSVNIRRAVWSSVLISCLLYIPTGWMGSSAFSFPNGATLLQVFGEDTEHGALSRLAEVSSYMFPLAVLITSVPVFVIVIRYNLLRGNICSNKMAIFLSAILPWLVTIPFQNMNAIAVILNWASLVFTSPANLVVPFVLFIVSKRHFASAVLDAKVCREMPTLPELGTSSTPTRPTAASGGMTIPMENIPVVIITESTDADGPEAVKPSGSNESCEAGRSSLTVEMPVYNRVSSPSKHRYYGQETINMRSDSPKEADHQRLSVDTAGKPIQEIHDPQRHSLSVSLSNSHTILHSSNTGMDEFLLMRRASPEPWAQSVRSILSAHTGSGTASGTSSGMSTPEPIEAHPIPELDYSHPGAGSGTLRNAEVWSTSTKDAESLVPAVFKAFPLLSPTSLVRPTRVSVVGCAIATAFVLTAIVYNIVETVKGSGG